MRAHSSFWGWRCPSGSPYDLSITTSILEHLTRWPRVALVYSERPRYICGRAGVQPSLRKHGFPLVPRCDESPAGPSCRSSRPPSLPSPQIPTSLDLFPPLAMLHALQYSPNVAIAFILHQWMFSSPVLMQIIRFVEPYPSVA